MLFSFNNEPNNVVNVRNCEGFGKYEESPMLFSFYTKPHNVVNVKNCEGFSKFEETPIMKPQMWSTGKNAKVVGISKI